MTGCPKCQQSASVVAGLRAELTKQQRRADLAEFRARASAAVPEGWVYGALAEQLKRLGRAS